MKEEEIQLKQKKENILDKVKRLFEDKKKRYLYMALFVLPFFIAMSIFGVIAFKEAKNLKNLISGTTQIDDSKKITSMNYELRENATDVQKEYFAELKRAIEVDNDTDEKIAGLICKNYIADFYTWTNKQGQFDIGGMHYVFDLEETKNNIYLQARDGFYKYLSNYIKEYGVSNLLEVESVNVVSSSKLPYEYKCLVNTHSYNDEEGHIYKDVEYDYNDAWQVKCTWTYKEGGKLSTSNYATAMNFIVVINNGRYEIVEANENEINAKDPQFDFDDEDNSDENNTEELDETNEEV